MANKPSTLEAVREIVKKFTTVGGDVKSESEIFYDLKIYGDDFFDMVCSLSKQFGTDFSEMHAPDYVPQEGFNPFVWLALLLGKRPFRSITVQMLANAVENGRWPRAA